MSKFKKRLQRLHQSRVRAVEEHATGRASGVFVGEALAPPSWATHGFTGSPPALQTTYDGSLRHGRYPLSSLLDTQFPLDPNEQLEANIDHDKVLFFDIETKGLADGALSFCLGLGRWSDDRFLITQLALDCEANEREMLERFSAQLEGAEAIVTFNGRSFDVPRVKSRVQTLGLADPFAGLYHLDLLQLSRRLLPASSMSLTELEEKLLQFHRHQDVPGSEAPGRYQRYGQSKDPGSLIPLFDHNRLDILSLVGLSIHLERWIRGARDGCSPPKKPKTELTQRLTQTYRLRNKDVGSKSKQPSASHARQGDGARLAEMRRTAEDHIKSGRALDALPTLFEIVTLAPEHIFAVRELARYYRSVGDEVLAAVFEERLARLAPY